MSDAIIARNYLWGLRKVQKITQLCLAASKGEGTISPQHPVEPLPLVPRNRLNENLSKGFSKTFALTPCEKHTLTYTQMNKHIGEKQS